MSVETIEVWDFIDPIDVDSDFVWTVMELSQLVVALLDLMNQPQHSWWCSRWAAARTELIVASSQLDGDPVALPKTRDLVPKLRTAVEDGVVDPGGAQLVDGIESLWWKLQELVDIS